MSEMDRKLCQDGWFWRGPFCNLEPTCRQLWERCSVEAYKVYTLENDTDVDIRLKEKYIDVGLYRLEKCKAEETLK